MTARTVSPSAVVVAVLLLLPTVASSYYVGLATQIFIMAIFATSLNILVGNVGLPSIGHAVYFGIAGYTAAFLCLSGAKSLWLAIGAGIAAAAAAAALFGLLALRARGAYFMIITLALAEVVWGIAFKWRSLTRGDDGLAGIGRPQTGIGDLEMDAAFYFTALAILGVVLAATFVLTRSPFGHALRGVRESESRMRGLGYDVWLYKYLAFIFAGAFAGMAGVLWVFYNGFVGPTNLGMELSVKALLMVILGGAGNFFGPALGAGIIVVLENVVSGFTERWSFVLGIVYVLAIMVFSDGIFSGVRGAGER